MPEIGNFDTFLREGRLREISLGAGHEAVIKALGLPSGATLPGEPWLMQAEWFGYGLLNFRFRGDAVDLIALSYMSYLEDVGIRSSKGLLTFREAPESAPSISALLAHISAMGIPFEPSSDPGDAGFSVPPEFVWRLASGIYIVGRHDQVISIASRASATAP